MPRARILLGAAALLAAALAAWYGLSRAPSPAPPPPPIATRTDAHPQAAEVPRAPAVAATGDPAPSLPPAIPATPRADVVTNASAYLSARYAANRTESFDRLAASTDPALQAAAVDIADECAVFSDHLFEQTLANIDKGAAPPRTKALQRETVEMERTHCSGFDAERIARGARMRRALAKENDPRMFAFGVPQGDRPMPEVIATAQRAAASGDALAIVQVGTFFAIRNDVPAGVEYDLGDGVTVPSGLLRDAFLLAACDYGAECGARSAFVATRCVSAGYCGSASLEDLFLRHTYSPAEAERLQAARQMVLSGIATGRWPARLWSPRTP